MTRISETDIQRYPKDNPKINEWYKTLKPTTQRLYTRYLIQFERISNIPLETLLIKKAQRQIDELQIRTLIINTTSKLSNSIQVVTDSAVRKFLRYWNIIVPPTTIKYEQTQFYRAYTKEELNQLLSYLDKPLEKLYAIICAESGLRAKTVLQLTWKHIQQDFNNRTDSIAIRLEPPFYKGKKKSGFALIGNRSRTLLKYCIEKQLINTQPDSKLFPFSYESISKIIRRAKQKANLDPTIEPIHGLRKYTEAQLEATKPPINERYRIMIMGRFKDIDAKNYSPRDFQTLRPEYEHAYPYIDYMNNAPDTAQQLSTKQTQLQDTITELTQNQTYLTNVLNILANRIGITIPTLTHQETHQIKQAPTPEAQLENMLNIGLPKLIQFNKLPLTQEQQEQIKQDTRKIHREASP